MDRTGQDGPVLDTILVTGNVEGIGEGPLKLYFSTKNKCGGGEIINILIQQNKGLITFSDIQGIAQICIIILIQMYCLIVNM